MTPSRAKKAKKVRREVTWSSGAPIRSFHQADYAWNPAQGSRKPSLDYYDQRGGTRERK